MVEHIRNEMALEMAKGDPTRLGDIVSDELYSAKLTDSPEKNRDLLSKIFKECGRSNTLKGFEACLIPDIEFLNLNKRLEGTKKFFQIINDAAERWDYYYKEHKL